MWQRRAGSESRKAQEGDVEWIWERTRRHYTVYLVISLSLCLPSDYVPDRRQGGDAKAVSLSLEITRVRGGFFPLLLKPWCLVVKGRSSGDARC